VHGLPNNVQDLPKIKIFAKVLKKKFSKMGRDFFTQFSAFVGVGDPRKTSLKLGSATKFGRGGEFFDRRPLSIDYFGSK